jgi:hypothetical protein
MQLDAPHHATSLGSIVGTSDNFTFEVCLYFNSTFIHSIALLDSEAWSSFIDIPFVRAHGVPLVNLPKPILVEAIYGHVLSLGVIAQATIPLLLRVGSHQAELPFYLIASPRHLIVLGLTWIGATVQ